MSVENFTIPWITAKRLSIKFNTDIDAVYTANEQRNAEQEDPRWRWTLIVKKCPSNFWALIDFFIARKGRWKAFYFTWDVNKQGNGQTYLVRFDHDGDELVFEQDDKFFYIPIVQTNN